MMNFKAYNNITKIVIPDNVQLSNNYFYNKFSEMKNLQSVSLPNSVNSLNSTFQNCLSLNMSPWCGNNVTDMRNAYYNCSNLTGSPICGPNVMKMQWAYYNCANLTGNPVCGENVTSMYSTYENCVNLTGSPVCGENVTGMSYAYENCVNLTGSPVCGENVTNMRNAYRNCINLTGSPVCGNNVTNMKRTYDGCSNLTGCPICGPNVTSMEDTYNGCINLSCNAYFYSKYLNGIRNCFYIRNTSAPLRVYVPMNSKTFHTVYHRNIYSDYSLIGREITWTDDMLTNNCYYNTTYNLYLYPVESVAKSYLNNELGNTFEPIDDNEYISNYNATSSIKTTWNYSASSLPIDAGEAFIVNINVADLTSITLNSMGVVYR